jgi:hypothetical protein
VTLKSFTGMSLMWFGRLALLVAVLVCKEPLFALAPIAAPLFGLAYHFGWRYLHGVTVVLPFQRAGDTFVTGGSDWGELFCGAIAWAVIAALAAWVCQRDNCLLKPWQ